MKTLICCVRHGQTDGNKSRTFQGRSDLPLNEIGISQANTTSELVKKCPIKWDVIISSPFIRAHQTCEIIKAAINYPSPIIIEPLAIERSFGKAEGLPINEENYRLISENFFENQESEQDIINRGASFLNKILHDYEGKNVLVVSHSHFIKSLFVPHDSSLKFDSGIPNASLNFLVYEDNKFQKMIINCKEENFKDII
ncbi:MAG: histidine phosphatase family protein [Bacilli bacterium]|nr:histidine phosphatase family protein [Bacilli bacterium]